MRDWLVQRYGVVSAVVGAVGVALILVSELADADWTRIFGAMLITAGGIGVGAWFGLSEPRRWPLQALLKQWRKWIAIVAALVLSAPVVGALVAALVGLLDSDGRQARGMTVVGGGAVAVMLVGAVLVALGLGVRAIDRAARDVRRGTDEADGSVA